MEQIQHYFSSNLNMRRMCLQSFILKSRTLRDLLLKTYTQIQEHTDSP